MKFFNKPIGITSNEFIIHLKKKLILALFKKIKIKNHFLFLMIKKILLDQKTLEVVIHHQK